MSRKEKIQKLKRDVYGGHSIREIQETLSDMLDLMEEQEEDLEAFRETKDWVVAKKWHDENIGEWNES